MPEYLVDTPVFAYALGGPHRSGRHAVHAATGVEHGLATMISPDSDFDGIPGLARIEPAALS